MTHKYFDNILDGKRVIITGANRGLGLLMARRFLECGAKVAICCAPDEDIDKAVQALKQLNSSYQVLGFRPNLTDLTELEEVVNTVVKNWGGVEVLVNNAGLYPSHTLDEYPKELFETVMDVNVLGPFLLAKCVAKVMEMQEKGVILNTSSMAGISGAMRNIGYTTSKFAIQGLTVGLARELGSKGIRVNGVAPAGMYRTNLNGDVEPMANIFEAPDNVRNAYEIAKKFCPLGAFMTHPDNVINAFIFLASDAAEFISGETIQVNGACIWPAASPASLLEY
jgi:NAD(P)-dependent dehydrogenase (short-subunit alcohol dehydrogenase family)